MNEDPSLKVSTRLKMLRKARRLTLRDLSEASGLSVNTISLIEREKTSPTIVTLHKLATALGVGVISFLEEETDKQVIFLQQGQRPSTRSGKALLRSLGTGLVNQTMEPLLITLEPDADSGPEPMTHLGHELAFCLNGQISYEINGEQYLLKPGDSLLFEASLPHRWHNEQSEPSQLLMVVQSTNGVHNTPV
jgi:quercetin dioxygenase-like cupin family protein/DNA-binding Xre family transcriptional regulator